MRILMIPCNAETQIDRHGNTKDMVFLCRQGQKPQILMHHVTSNIEASATDKNMTAMLVRGEFLTGQSFQDLQDGDQLILTTNRRYGVAFEPFYMDMFTDGTMLLPFEPEDTVLKLAAMMETGPKVYLVTQDAYPQLDQAAQVMRKAMDLYAEHPEFQHIMLNSADGPRSCSLVELASLQPKEKHSVLIALFLAISSARKTSLTAANRILEECTFEKEFSLLTQEEQVGTFIEFSKMAATRKKEHVPDSLLETISKSPEYETVVSQLKKQGLGISRTQQFNVLQQVGYFSKGQDILYNLSDMGAGKTLMTVEAIFLLDLKQMSSWAGKRENYAHVNVQELYLPDKHIIAPTLSVKSSWVETFRLFYDVAEIDEMTYSLSVEYGDMRATSRIYISPFTVRDGKMFTKEPLPYAEDRTYLIIDEIHQLVAKPISRTKFFPPKTVPFSTYQIFVLSGTMSNLKTAQWYHFKRFLGMQMTEGSVTNAKANADRNYEEYKTSIVAAANDIRTKQHRYFDVEDMTAGNSYRHQNEKKQTAVEREFFTKYGSQIIVPNRLGEQPVSVEGTLGSSYKFDLVTDPMEMDTINFELFYEIVGSQAITAQSMQIAEELFGAQKKQHVSDIIKTVSPLSKEDIRILKALHHIAEDHNCYKSLSIAKAINNAILNLNDGLQTKNIYEIVSGFAERNTRFFEYLGTLDINILEQLPKSGLIGMPKLEDTDKFKVLKDILEREKDETHLIVVNDYGALKALSDALGIEHLSKSDLKKELDYQDLLDGLFEKQSIVIVTQDMIKSSLDLVQANRLIQYQLNTEISDIIQTQNRINRIGQTRETRGYYIASDQLQENLIKLFLESYRNIRVAHKGIVELFADITSQINVINDYLERAFIAMDGSETEEPEEIQEPEDRAGLPASQLASKAAVPKGASILHTDGISKAILYPQNGNILVLVPLDTGTAFPLGQLRSDVMPGLSAMKTIQWNLETDRIEEEKE